MLDFVMSGQVLPTDSLLHRLDPRTRLLGFVGLLALLVGATSARQAALVLCATLGLVALVRVPWGYALRGVRMLLPWLMFIGLFQLLLGVGNAPGCASVLVWGPLRLTECGLGAVALALTRFAGLVLLMNLFLWTTSIPSLVHALEALARPLDRLGVPAHQLTLVGVIAVRFVPTMALELERLQKAQAARGADLAGGGGGLVRRIRRTLPMLVPLFVLALRRAERLAEAMEARAYRGGVRGSYVRLRLGLGDWLALGLTALFALVVLQI